MSATELIQQVAALPQRERMQFEQLFQAMKHGILSPGPASPANWPDFGDRLRLIYGEKTVPDSQSIMDDGRGDR